MTDTDYTPEPQPTSVGAYLTRERARRRLSISEVARRADMQASTLSRIETGTIQAPSTDVLRKLARVLDIPTLKLFTVAGYADGNDLPELEPYLRSKYGDRLPGEAAAEFAAIAKKFGLDPTKTGGDDEAP